MSWLAIFMASGYALLGMDLIADMNYMDAFVALTVSAVFAFGLLDVFSAKKRGAAHVLTGGLLSMIFTVYFVIEQIANGLETLISDNTWKLEEKSALLFAVLLGVGGVVSFFISKKTFESAKIKKRG